MPQKRTQPVATATATSTKDSKGPGKRSKPKGSSPSTAAVNGESNSPPTPSLTPSSSTTPPSSLTPLSLGRPIQSRKLARAAMKGHHHGNGGHGGHNAGTGAKGTMKSRRAVGDGPEAELSGDDDLGSGSDEERVLEEREELVGAKSVERKEVSMGLLLYGAKVRPEPHSISRGYELLTSPASRLVIPFDTIPSVTPKPTLGKPFAARHGHTSPMSGYGKGSGMGLGSTPSSPGFSDDVEWEWEDLCLEMNVVDLTSSISAVVMGSQAGSGVNKKDAYAEVVKRVAV